MDSLRFDVLAPGKVLEQDVECFSVAEYSGDKGLAISVAPQAVPGIVFQHHGGRSAIQSIVTPSGATTPPVLFLYGPGIEPSTMNFTPGPYISIQVVLKPYALSTLLGLNAAALDTPFVELSECSAGTLAQRLLEANDRAKQLALLADFLAAQLRQARSRDEMVAASLRLIHDNAASISVKHLLNHLNVSERHFERRFRQTVGVAPQAYIRVKRFHAALRLLKTRRYERLTDIAQAAGFYDQSHFNRDVKQFARLSPKHVAQKEDDFYHDQTGYSYL